MPPRGSKKNTSIPPAVGNAKNRTPQNRNLRMPREIPSSAVPAFIDPQYGGQRGGQRDFSSAPPPAVDPFGIPVPNQRRPASFSQPPFSQPSFSQPTFSQQPGYSQQPGLQPPFGAPPSFPGPSGAASSQQGRKHQRQESAGANLSPQKRRFAEQQAAVFREQERELTDAEKIRMFDDLQRSQRLPYGGHAAQEIRRGSQENLAFEEESPTIRGNSGANLSAAAPEFRQLNDIVRQPDTASDLESRLPAREDEPEYADDDYVPDDQDDMPPKAAGRKKAGSRSGQATKAKASAATPKPVGRSRPRGGLARDEEWDGVYRAGNVVPDDRASQQQAFAQYLGAVEEDLHELMCAACAINLTTGRNSRDPCDVVHNPCARCKKSKKECWDVYDPQINALINQVWIRQHAWYETMSDAQRGSTFGVKIEKEIAAGVKLIGEKMALIIPPTVPGLDNWRVEKTNARLAVSNEALVRQGEMRQAQMMINMGIMPHARRVLVSEEELQDRFGVLYRSLADFHAALANGGDIEYDDDSE